MFASMQSSCSAIGGSENAPSLEQCTATTTTTTTTTTNTTTPCICDQGWEEYDDHCYYYSTHQKNWNDAEEYCQEEGGHLASVNTKAIQDYVVDELKRRGFDGVWFGGNDIAEEGVWEWTDRTPWEFTNWGPGQPDNQFGRQHCFRYEAIWPWDDNECWVESYFVCSKNIC